MPDFFLHFFKNLSSKKYYIKADKRLKMLIPSLVLLILTTVVFFWYQLVSDFSRVYIIDDINKVPFNNTGLLLGTNKELSDGRPNMYFFNRIQAATELYRAGKIQHIIVSGACHGDSYNEPDDMKAELIRNNVPADIIYPDYRGSRTLDSVIRSREIFGQNSITVISQQFHNERAIFIARNKGIDAIAFNAKDLPFHIGFITNCREIIARIRLFFDIYT